jgi:hypothetical protein
LKGFLFLLHLEIEGKGRAIDEDYQGFLQLFGSQDDRMIRIMGRVAFL